MDSLEEYYWPPSPVSERVESGWGEIKLSIKEFFKNLQSIILGRIKRGPWSLLELPRSSDDMGVE